MGPSLFGKGSNIDAEVSAFLASVKVDTAPPRMSGKLMFALDATASRQPTWDLAAGLQAQMFRAVANLGGLKVMLTYFRGPEEYQGSGWLSSPSDVLNLMRTIKCESGMTQYGRVFQHAAREHAKAKIGAVVLEERPVEKLITQARNLGVPTFTFLEGADSTAAQVFSAIADVTGGAFARFDANSAQHLGELLKTAAASAVGGVELLEARKDLTDIKLLSQLRKGKS